MFLSGRALTRMCVSSMYLSGWFLGPVRIRDLFSIEGWMLYDMMPLAEQFYPDDLELLKSDQKFYDNACDVRKTNPTDQGSLRSVWVGDFAHEMMNWFARSELDGTHKAWLLQKDGTVVIPDNLLYSCRLKSDVKAKKMFEESTPGDKIVFFEKVVLPVLPRLMNCFEKI